MRVHLVGLICSPLDDNAMSLVAGLGAVVFTPVSYRPGYLATGPATLVAALLPARVRISSRPAAAA